MSGGSYNYLYSQYGTPEELFKHTDDIEAMADRLAGLGYAPDAAAETAQVLLTIRQTEVWLSAMQQRLAGVWKAVEWVDSRDSGEEVIKDALEKYRERSPTGVPV